MDLKRYFRYHYIRILRLKDSPTKIAKGVALGVAMEFLPLPFINILIAWLIARLTGINSLAAVMTSVALKPAAFTAFVPLNILVSRLLGGGGARIAPHQLVPEMSMTPQVTAFQFYSEKLKVLGLHYLAASTINALLWGLVVFFILNRALALRQERRLRRKGGKVRPTLPAQKDPQD